MERKMETMNQQAPINQAMDADTEDTPRRPYEAPAVVSSEGRPLHALLGTTAACSDTTGGTGDLGLGCNQI